MIKYSTRVFSLAIFCSVVFEVANILFLFCINRYDGVAIFKVLMCSSIDKFKLFITVRTWDTDLLHFLIDLFTISHFG